MKIAATIARYLLGLIILVFGSNIYFHFIPAPPIPPGPLANFSSSITDSHYVYVLGLFQVVPAILLLINRYIPLALALLAPVIVNIVCIHVFLSPSGLPIAALVTIFWILVFLRVRSSFDSIFEARSQQ